MAFPSLRRLALASLGVACLFGMLAAVGSAYAQQEPALYVASGIAVDLTGDIATARDQALLQAQREGIRQVFAEIVPEDALARLPLPGDEEITGWVHDFEIEDEKTSATHYLGRFTFRFAAAAVQDYLARHQVKFASPQARPLLVLPVFINDAGDTLLWGSGNLWLNAWPSGAARAGQVSLVLPRNDLDDAGAVTAEQALAGDSLRLPLMQQRYAAGAVLIAVAHLFPADADGVRRLDLALARYEGASVTRYAETLSGPAVDQLLADGVAHSMTAIEQDWKAQNLVDAGKPQPLEIRVPIDSLRAWVEIKKRLSGIPAIKGVDLLELTRKSALLRVLYVGEEAQFIHALSQQGLVFASDGPASGTLRLDMPVQQ